MLGGGEFSSRWRTDVEPSEEEEEEEEECVFFLGEKEGGSGSDIGSKSSLLMLIDEQKVCAAEGDNVFRRFCCRDMPISVIKSDCAASVVLETVGWRADVLCKVSLFVMRSGMKMFPSEEGRENIDGVDSEFECASTARGNSSFIACYYEVGQ